MTDDPARAVVERISADDSLMRLLYLRRPEAMDELAAIIRDAYAAQPIELVPATPQGLVQAILDNEAASQPAPTIRERAEAAAHELDRVTVDNLALHSYVTRYNERAMITILIRHFSDLEPQAELREILQWALHLMPTDSGADLIEISYGQEVRDWRAKAKAALRKKDTNGK